MTCESYLSVFSLCVLFFKLFSVFGLHLLSIDNFVFFIIKKIEVISYELLQIIWNTSIWGPKKLSLSFHIFFMDFLILFFLLMTPVLVSPALPSFPSLDSDRDLPTGLMPLDGHSLLLLTISSLTFQNSSSQGNHPPTPSIQGRNLVVNLDFTFSYTPLTH